MKFKELVAVSGKSGLFQIVAQRPSGLLVKQLGTQKTQFLSNRIHTFSPLDSISIYTIDTDSDAEPLRNIVRKMVEAHQSGELALPAKDSNRVLRDYFTEILPNHDTDRVYDRDIKKLVTWVETIQQFDIDLSADEEDADTDSETNEEETDSAKAMDKEVQSDVDEMANTNEANDTSVISNEEKTEAAD